MLRNSDRIDFGVRESYQLTFTVEPGEIHRILDQFSTTSRTPAPRGPIILGKLRSLMEVARALQNSLSTQEVLTAVVDAALAVTGCERGFLMLRKVAIWKSPWLATRTGSHFQPRICVCPLR